ncbi:MAG: ATP-binding protein [bacterium]
MNKQNPSPDKKKHTAIEPLDQIHGFAYNMLLDLAAKFHKLPVDQIETAIDDMFETVGKEANVDRIFLLNLDEEKNRLRNTHEWCAPDIEPKIGSLQSVSLRIFEDLITVLNKGVFLHIPDSDNLPVDPGIQYLFDHHNFRTLIMLPIVLSESCTGFVGFETVRKKQRFSENDIHIFSAVTRFVTDAFAKQRASNDVVHYDPFLNQIVDTIPDPIFVKNQQHRWIVINEAFCKFLGYSRSELLGKSDYDFFPKHEADVFWEKDKLVFESGVENINEEPITDASGKEHIISTKKSPFTVKETNETYLTGLIRDITEQKRSEKALRDALAQAQAATVAKSRFLANMSHEIRTPMSGVLGMASLLAETNLDKEQRHYIDLLMQSGERMMRTINDLLDISRIEAGKLEISKKPLNLKKLMTSILTPIAKLAEKKGLIFTFDVSEDIPENLEGDPDRIGQILINLAGNAIKFTKVGHVNVKAELLQKTETSVHLQFIVSDTGIGISKDQQASLYDSFFQVDGSDTREYGGTGLGLSISKQLVEMMNGELHIESTLGKGTICLFTLELSISSSAPTDPVTSMLKPQIRKNARILLVEDDQVSAILANALIKKLGLKSDTAVNGQHALKLLTSNNYDLIMMDCQMPIMNGFDATRAIRSGEAGEAVKSIPIIALTAYAMKDDQAKCIDSGMNDHLSKPLDYNSLVAVLNKWLS